MCEQLNRKNETDNDQVASIPELLKMEYPILRSEILKRVEMRQQIISFTLTIAGVFIGVGVKFSSIALLYPPLAVFLAAGWVQNDLIINRAAAYVREFIESPVSVSHAPGWEHYCEQKRETHGTAWLLLRLSHGGTFFITQLMAVLIGLFSFSQTKVEWTLLGIDTIAILIVIILVGQAKRTKTANAANSADAKSRAAD
jgi:uncharacterized membrane protein YqaE (UPF0057 family)